jgi:hypothetical protein
MRMVDVPYSQQKPGPYDGTNPTTVTETGAGTGKTVDILGLSVTVAGSVMVALILRSPWSLLLIPVIGIPHLAYCLLKRRRTIYLQ